MQTDYYETRKTMLKMLSTITSIGNSFCVWEYEQNMLIYAYQGNIEMKLKPTAQLQFRSQRTSYSLGLLSEYLKWLNLPFN